MGVSFVRWLWVCYEANMGVSFVRWLWVCHEGGMGVSFLVLDGPGTHTFVVSSSLEWNQPVSDRL